MLCITVLHRPVRRDTIGWQSQVPDAIEASHTILSLLSFCYFLIGTSNLSLKALCCYWRRLFSKRIWIMCSYLCVSFGVYLHSICIYVLSHQRIGHAVLKEKAFRVYFKKSIHLSYLSLETSANLVMSRAIFPYLVTRGRCKTRHMGSLQM